MSASYFDLDFPFVYISSLSLLFHFVRFISKVASASDPQSLKAKSGNAAASQFSVDFQEAALQRKSRKGPANKKAFDLSATTPLDARPRTEKPAAAPEVNPELKRFLFARKYGGHCRNLALMGLLTPDQLLEFCQSSDAAVALQNARTGLNLSSFEASVFIKAVASSKDPDSLKSLKKFQVRFLFTRTLSFVFFVALLLRSLFLIDTKGSVVPMSPRLSV